MKINFSPQLQMNPLMGIGAALGGVAAVGKFFQGIGQRKEGKRIHPIFNQYQASPFAKQQLGMAQNMFNADAPGARELERNAYTNQAQAFGNLQRNATDPTQLLSLAGQAQGQTNDVFQNAQQMRMQNKYNMLGNLNQAYGANINEGDKVYNSMMQKFQMDSAQKNALMGAGSQNMFGGLGDLASLGIQSGQLFGGGNQQQPQGDQMQLGDGGVGRSWQTNAARNFRNY